MAGGRGWYRGWKGGWREVTEWAFIYTFAFRPLRATVQPKFGLNISNVKNVFRLFLSTDVILLLRRNANMYSTIYYPLGALLLI